MTTDERNKFYKLRSRLAMSGLIIFFLCYWIYNLKIDIENEKSNVVAITEQSKIKDESIILLRKRLDSIVKIFNHPPIPVEKPKVKLPKKDTTKVEIKLDTLPKLDSVPKIQDTTQTL